MQTTLELVAEFYGLDAIERAAAAFAHLATVTIESGAPRHRVHLQPLDTMGLDSLRLEFANWVLAAGAEARDDRERPLAVAPAVP